MQIGVLIPTWQRTDLLKMCLDSLVSQDEKADEIVVVVRDSDQESRRLVESFQGNLPLKIVQAKEPGVIHAENCGLKVISSDIICFLDDDATVPPHWIKGIKTHFKNPEILGVGGPDFIVKHHDPNYPYPKDSVGKITWYGRVIGNHHQKISKILKVDVLKGVNMAFRREAISYLDQNLQSEHHEGNGSQWELDLCLQMRQYAGDLIFDPSLLVRHYSDHTHFLKWDSIMNNARNLSYVMLKNLNFSSKIYFLFYIILIGNNQIIGIVKLISMYLTGADSPGNILKSFFYTTLGFWKGILSLRHRPPYNTLNNSDAKKTLMK